MPLGAQYPAVVAGGVDAVTIHYGRNDKLLRAWELLLMDAGCELHGYTSDVTRTWPVSGSFSPAQRDVYDIVLDCHGCAPLCLARECGLSSGHAQHPSMLIDASISLGRPDCVGLPPRHLPRRASLVSKHPRIRCRVCVGTMAKCLDASYTVMLESAAGCWAQALLGRKQSRKQPPRRALALRPAAARGAQVPGPPGSAGVRWRLSRLLSARCRCVIVAF